MLKLVERIGFWENLKKFMMRGSATSFIFKQGRFLGCICGKASSPEFCHA
jgi:hypothetical protein